MPVDRMDLLAVDVGLRAEQAFFPYPFCITKVVLLKLPQTPRYPIVRVPITARLQVQAVAGIISP